MNLSVIKGRLTKDPELSFFESKKEEHCPRCNFSVAVDRRFGDEVDFFNCVVFGKRAEVIDKYFSKGKAILCKGRMEQNRYQDKEWNNRTSWKFIVDDFEFCEKKSDNGNSEPKADGFEQIEEDVPF